MPKNKAVQLDNCVPGIEDLAVRCGSSAQGEGVNVSFRLEPKLKLKIKPKY